MGIVKDDKGWHKVLTSNRLIELHPFYYITDEYMVRDDVADWISEYIGPFNKTISVTWYWHFYGQDHAIFKFKSREHAIHFKMVWG